MVNYKFLSLCFLILLGSSVMAQKMTSNTKVIGNIVYDAENKGSVTAGNLSIGKFYRFSREPDTTYKDEYPNNWSDGAKLTDEVLNTGPELNTAQYVGWKGTRDLEITVDLGRIQSLEKLNVNGMASVQLNAQEPVGAAVFVKQEKNGKWVLFAKQNFANNKANTGNKPFSIEVGGPAIKARFVKLVLKPSSIGGKSGLILLDELSLLGKIKIPGVLFQLKVVFMEHFLLL